MKTTEKNEYYPAYKTSIYSIICAITKFIIPFSRNKNESTYLYVFCNKPFAIILNFYFVSDVFL